MKTLFKSSLKAIATIVLIFVAYIVAIIIARAPLAPDIGVDHYTELKSQGVPMIKAVRLENPPGHICVFGDVEAMIWTLPSGPPAYLFDPSGNLVEFTLDVGDSTKFQNEYQIYDGTKMTMAEVEAQFAEVLQGRDRYP